MSRKAAKAFVEKMKADASFRDKVMAVEDVKERMKLINREGFEVTMDDIKLLHDELDLSEIAKVAGGGWCGVVSKAPQYPASEASVAC